MPFSLEIIVFFVVSALAATWILVDYRWRADAPAWERVAWWIGTTVALPIFLPMYLIAARPAGRLVRCPACGRQTLAHRAACGHCGSAIAFEPAPPVWGLGEVVGVAVVFTLGLPTVLAVLDIGATPSLPVVAAVVVAQAAIFLVLPLYIVRRRYGLPRSAVGLRFERWPLWTGLGLAAGAVSIALSVLLERLAIYLIGFVAGRDRAAAMAEQEHLADVLTAILKGPLAVADLVLVFLLVCALVPVAEELFFRGFVYGALRRWGVAAAALLSALFFAAVHNQIVHFLPIFALGLILALLYERTGSLLPAMLVHAVNNVVALLSALNDWRF
ncbi:MAG TPA: CPBP family glutamic-type intramembrane protease [bacterium]|nr:CPBP family glutamic-type intramembrane protease [bacterium]